MEVLAGFLQTLMKHLDALFELAFRTDEALRFGRPRLRLAGVQFTPAAFDQACHLGRDDWIDASHIRRTADLAAMISSKSNLLTAGFPCTDLSQAGLTAGFAGRRSSLIRDVVKLLKLRPFPHVLIENVPNWRHLHGGQYFAEVINALERLGYRWAYRTIDAHAFGLPQRRLRLFLYASLEHAPWQTLLTGDALIPVRQYALTKAAHGFYWTEGNRGLGWGEDCIPTLKGGSAVAIPSPPAIVMPDLSIVTPNIADVERLQGFPAHWTALEGDPVRKFNSRKRWVLVGNAVNVEVAAWIGKQLASPPQNVLLEKSKPLRKGDRWPSAAWFDGHRRWRADVGTWPVDKSRHSLAEFLQFPAPPCRSERRRGSITDC
jgi:DNA (cytosine-5)-methyltransferase 1